MNDGWADDWAADKYLSAVIGDTYYRAYKHRETAIDSYMGGITTDEDAWGKTASELGAYLRPGEWVGLTINGNCAVYGQLYELPESFPMGEYMIRCFVPNNARESGYEIMFVSRQFYEFTPVVRSAVATIVAEIQRRGSVLAGQRNVGRPMLEAAGV